MKGTSFELLGNDALSVYNNWIITSYYLLKEYNIWSKAKLYLENIHLNNSKFSSAEYKEAYNYLVLRQFLINNPVNQFGTTHYIIDFTVNENIYRELSEDILYILLNLTLTDKIIGNNDLEKSLDNNQKFLGILTNIIQDHYDQNQDGYKCLEYLRWYTVNNWLSADQIKFIYKNYK